MKDEDRKRLTIFLGKCWHCYNWVGTIYSHELRQRVCGWKCKCGHISGYNFDAKKNELQNRPFATEVDMMALYKRMHEVGKWDDFDDCAFTSYCKETEGRLPSEDIRYTAWLFCLSGEGYEERCQMVNDFLEEKP